MHHLVLTWRVSIGPKSFTYFGLLYSLFQIILGAKERMGNSLTAGPAPAPAAPVNSDCPIQAGEAAKDGVNPLNMMPPPNQVL